MDAQVLNRRLTVMLHAEVHGYIRLIEQDDVATLRMPSAALQFMMEAVRRQLFVTP